MSLTLNDLFIDLVLDDLNLSKIILDNIEYTYLSMYTTNIYIGYGVNFEIGQHWSN